MNPVQWIESLGVRVWVDGDRLTLEGLAALGPQRASEVVAYARENKLQLLNELGGPSGLPARPCLGCGQLFTPQDENKRYCKVRCFDTMRPTACGVFCKKQELNRHG